MNVFCVLFLVLSDTVGNQADKVPSYLVSVRNVSNCHICAGSMLSVSWGITSIECRNSASHIMPGLSKLEICNEAGENNYLNNILRWEPISSSGILLLKVKSFGRKHGILGLPTTSCFNSPPKTGKVRGWSFDNRTSKFVMTTIDRVKLEDVFSKDNAFSEELFKISKGSPLIANDDIYGVFINFTRLFSEIYVAKDWIKNIIEEA